MATGTVKWFNTTKGYGFIAPDSGEKDVFLHFTALKEAGLDSIDEGQKVTFEVTENRGKTCAGEVKLAQ